MNYQAYFDAARKAGFSGGSALTIAAIALTQSKGGTFDFNHAYGETLGGTMFSHYSSYNDGSYVQNMPNKTPWVPYNSANQNVPKAGSGIDPTTRKPFRMDVSKDAPTPNKSSLGKPFSVPNSGQTSKSQDKGNAFQQAAGDFNKWRGDVGKSVGNQPLKNDQQIADAVTGGFWSQIKDAPMRALKVIVGIVLIISSFILLLIPPVKDALLGTAKPLVKGAIKKAVFK